MFRSRSAIQHFGSGSALDPHSMVAGIRIRIPNADPDPGGLKKKKKTYKRQIIRHKKDKKECN
jgi:hypothetical protein